jgi:hypothetical protein
MALKDAAPSMVEGVERLLQQGASKILKCEPDDVHIKDLVVLNRQVGAEDEKGHMPEQVQKDRRKS